MRLIRHLIVLALVMTSCNAQAGFDFQRCVLNFFDLVFGPERSQTGNPYSYPPQGTPQSREALFAAGDFVVTRNGGLMLTSGGDRTIVKVSTMLTNANLGPMGDRRQTILKNRFPELRISPSSRATIQGSSVWPEYYELVLVHPPEMSPADREKRRLELFQALDSELH